MGPLAIALQVEKIDERRTTRALVNADRQIEIAGFLIDREKIRIVQCASALDAAEENPTAPCSFAQRNSLIDSSMERSGGITTHFKRSFPFAQASAIQRL